VSNLLLVKASARGREMAVRMAIGASRRRLVRQLASESLLLGLAGGGGLRTSLAYETLPALLSLVPPDLPRWMQFSLDRRVLLFPLAASLATSLAFGLVPAFGSSRVDLSRAIKDGGRAGSGARYQLLRNGLVVSEVALSVILLAAAGLTVRSFLALRSQNLGYRPDHVRSLEVVYPTMRYPNGPKAHDLISRLTADISTLPGVKSAAFTAGIPLNDGWSRVYTIEGRPRPLQDMPWVNHVVVVPGYFGTLGIRLLEGRDFTEADYDDQHQLIVTSAFARANWPNESAVGKHVRFGPPDRNEPWNTIVGVVADNRHEQHKADGRPVVYLTYRDNIAPSSLLARTSGDPAKIASALRARIRAFDADIALYHVITLPQLIARASWQDRFLAILFPALAILVLTLASVGLYAALSYTVSLHSREIGSRMALGAFTGTVQGMLLRQGMTLAARDSQSAWPSRSDSPGFSNRNCSGFGLTIPLLMR
jgi:predicted permease